MGGCLVISVSIITEMTWCGYQTGVVIIYVAQTQARAGKKLPEAIYKKQTKLSSPSRQISSKGVDLSREWGQGQQSKKQISMHVHEAQCNEHISINSWRQRAQFVLFLAENILSLSSDGRQSSQVVRILSRMNVMVSRTLGIK